jgi:hypothetical protein
VNAPCARAFAATIVTVLGLAAGAISYFHMHELALRNGETDWRAHVFPITVDGVEIVASVLLFVAHLTGRKPRRLVWPTMIISTVISIGANMLVATNGPIGCAVAGWPPNALLLAIKLLLGLLEDYAPGGT